MAAAAATGTPRWSSSSSSFNAFASRTPPPSETCALVILSLLGLQPAHLSPPPRSSTERQSGQLEWDLSQVSMHGTWKAWLHLGSSRRLSPSRNSPRQTEQSVLSTKPSPRLYLHTRLVHPVRQRDAPRLLAPGIVSAVGAAAAAAVSAGAKESVPEGAEGAALTRRKALASTPMMAMTSGEKVGPEESSELEPVMSKAGGGGGKMK
uniref:Uncharacterized protein n=1 Tax=Oryza rufipogon TaxID=4529 RepID=A0A0E0NJH5_ORYRU